MLKAGFIQKWKADFWPSQDRCSSTAYGGAGRQKKVDLEDMQGSFYLLLLGKDSTEMWPSDCQHLLIIKPQSVTT